MTTPRPLWRWWLHGLACSVYFRTRHGSRLRDWSLALPAWCVLPEWLGWDVENDCDTARGGDGETPF